jgi:glycosyltransferase involved in cell wall biosynthesis
MFKVLVISYYFPPMGLSGVQRTLKFTKYMSKYNWKPTVITSGNTGYYAHDEYLLREAENADIEIIRTEGKDPNSILSRYGTIKMPRESIRKLLGKISKAIFIPDNKKSWAKHAYEKAKEILEKESFDIIFVSIPPFSAFDMAAKLKKEFSIPLFVDYRDLWTGNQFAYYPTPYHKSKHKKLEDAALRVADRIIVVNRRIKEELLQNFQFLKFEDVSIIPHGFDPADFDNLEPDPKANSKIKITYSGIFYENITPKYFLNAFKKITLERPDVAANIELHFVGLFRKENLNLVKKLKLESFVHIHGYLNHRESLKKIISSDILWLTISNTQNMDKVSAGKLFEYFGTRKPVIAAVPDGASKTAALEYGASFIADPKNVEAIKDTVVKVHDLYHEDKLPVPNEEFVLGHNRETLTERLTKEFQFNLKEIV